MTELKIMPEGGRYIQMLELKGIVKNYAAGDMTVNALRGIDLRFRRNEFVSILGPSGCGKTTLLNIIGGLDKYTEGDLVINGRSTKDFRDRDWDAYRNHSIGFVFQSYNLIPHQTVLQNVELSLTLSGIPKAERKARAIKALEDVGLGTQLRKKPTEMSGGQMQRVAIARALVNNPDIILADEPTGALDTETSLQVMDILKKVAENRLVIMVTHNPELAAKYSTRTVRMLDGRITGDSAPLSEAEIKAEAAADEAERIQSGGKKRKKKPSMSFGTSFMLSLKNLFTKKGRTVLTSFAGSIGIIGIALIFSVSQGMTSYISIVQEETLSSYPLTIEAQHTDFGELMKAFMSPVSNSSEHEKDGVYQKPSLYEFVNAISNVGQRENDLRDFRKYIERSRLDKETGLGKTLSGVQYSYDFDMLVYTENVDGKIIRSDSEALMKKLMAKFFGSSMMSGSSSSGNTGIFSSLTSGTSSFGMWQELLGGDNGSQVGSLLEKQYDVIYGSWPASYNQIVLVVDKNNEIDDITLYSLGLKSEEDINKILEAAANKTEIPVETKKWTYEDICGMTFRTVLSSDCYVKSQSTGLYTDMRDTDAGMRYLYDNGIDLKVVGIIRPKEDALSPMLTGSVGYTRALTEYIIARMAESDAVKAQIASPEKSILSGLPFEESAASLTVSEKAEKFRTYIAGLDGAGKASSFIKIQCIPPAEVLDASVKQILSSVTYEQICAQMTTAMAQETGMSEEEIASYLDEMGKEKLTALFTEAITEQVKASYAEQAKAKLAAMTTEQLSAAMTASLSGYSDEQCAEYYGLVTEFSDLSYDEVMHRLGYVDIDVPSRINLYASTFADKEALEDSIDDYNAGKDEAGKITYTDYAGLMMSSVTTIINAITYVLIAFVSVSLIVSSIMIGVITLISVQERTKEIGILRAIGASKKNVSGMFNAETMIIGFTSGMFGVLFTYLLCIPINLILHSLTGIGNLNAYLPIGAAVILVCISMLLTLISGIIPSRSAAKKDPVVALRTE